MKHFYRLTPIIHEWVDTVIKNKKLLYHIINSYGSPVHVYSVTPFIDNLISFNEMLKKYLQKSFVFFARKPNHSFIFTKTAIDNGFGIDTASFNELKQSVDYNSEANYVYTAAVKEKKAIELAIKYGKTIILDNEDEINLVSTIAKTMNQVASVGLRISGFKLVSKTIYSRFGFQLESILKIINKVQVNKCFNLQGFHFHLNGYDIFERATAAHQLINIVIKARNIGANIKFIDIGGGFLVNYLRSKKEWGQFNEALIQAVENKIEPITYLNHPLHLFNVNGKAVQVGNLYPYFNETNKQILLEKILLEKFSGKPLYQLLNENDIELRIEPGRSALYQSGFTMASVAFRKKDKFNNWLVGLQMNFTQLLSSSNEFALDPVVLYQNQRRIKNSYFDCVFAGNYCMERDIILKRIIQLPQLPEINDLILFVNTAGYMSHFLATRSHLFENPYNIFINEKNNNIDVDRYRS